VKAKGTRATGTRCDSYVAANSTSKRRRSGALIFHLCLYCGVAACLAFGLYALFQPSHRINPGLAAYKPPPATVIDYGHPIVRPQLAFVQPAASADPLTPEPETTGRSSPAPQPDVSDPLPQPPRQASKSNQTRHREFRAAPPQRERVACIPRYDSSGAQTGAC
jgi:hypothetical protein